MDELTPTDKLSPLALAIMSQIGSSATTGLKSFITCINIQDFVTLLCYPFISVTGSTCIHVCTVHMYISYIILYNSGLRLYLQVLFPILFLWLSWNLHVTHELDFLCCTCLCILNLCRISYILLRFARASQTLCAAQIYTNCSMYFLNSDPICMSLGYSH